MTTGDRIRKLRLSLSMTQQELGDAIGVQKAAINKYETGVVVNLKRSTIAALAKALNTTPTELLGYDEDEQRFPKTIDLQSVKNLVPIRTRRIPVLGQIAAGVPILTEENHEDFISVDEDIRCDAAVRVVGDSMTPTFLDGDFVLIRCQDDVDDGQIAAVIVDDSATLKHVYHIPNGVQLVSDNAKYRPMIYAGDEAAAVRIFGLAVAFQRRVEY